MKVYLCGGINGLSDADCTDWREAAKQRLVGIETLDPMRRDYRGQESEKYELIVQNDIKDIHACDIILVNAVRPSWGTAMEIHYAFCAGKRIIAVVPDIALVSPWLRYHCNYLCESFDEAFKMIKA